MALMDPRILRGKRVLITGHTGFKGAWLTLWLEKIGAEVSGIALDPTDKGSLYPRCDLAGRPHDLRCDIRDGARLGDLMRDLEPEVVFHLAAQSLVLRGYRSPAETFDVNVMGTVNVLEAIRTVPSVRAAVMVTTDKCYDDRGDLRPYRETDPLGGRDPYSASKGAAEIAIASYRRSFFNVAGAAGIASARSGNVIGGGDWSADRIVPDLFRAIAVKRSLPVRKPGAIRPWQHVLEPLHGYMVLAARLLEDPAGHAEAWNFGPDPMHGHTVGELVDALIAQAGTGSWHEAITPDAVHEADVLRLDIQKAADRLRWKPRLSFAATVQLTTEWYLRADREDARALCSEQIDRYESLADH